MAISVKRLAGATGAEIKGADLLWDTRSTMHRAVADYDMEEARHMARDEG
ncbi:MAG: hypothetical protein QF827_02540 [Alphaproteobacteria bacterium]|jgi:hypothetical protein|nr:hypothetical protein [Alphaproteobacteria bacterium]